MTTAAMPTALADLSGTTGPARSGAGRVGRVVAPVVASNAGPVAATEDHLPEIAPLINAFLARTRA